MHQGVAVRAMIVRDLFPGVTGSSPLNNFSRQPLVLDLQLVELNLVCEAKVSRDLPGLAARSRSCFH